MPDFDDAKIDGEVPLNIVAQQLPVKGIGIGTGSSAGTTGETVWQAGDTAASAFTRWKDANTGAPSSNSSLLVELGEGGLVPQIYAEMQDTNITVSLSNLELAKQMASFAKLRSRYSHLEDDHLIDMLMMGLRIPEQEWSEPILLARQSTLVGYSQRFATDAANLDKSVTTGLTYVDLPIRMPHTNIGGVIMVTVETVPEQLYERRQDFFLDNTDPAKLPEAMRDFLDPQKVEIVQNEEIDVKHTVPDSIFGYEPLNSKWRRDLVRLGGRFYRPDPQAAWDEDRGYIWASEAVDPELNEDFVLATNVHQNVFQYSGEDAEPFRVQAIGEVRIAGLTQFGKGLEEASGDYKRILEEVDLTRITPEEEEE